MILKKKFKLINNAGFGKTIGNLGKHRDITKKKKEELLSIRTKLSCYKDMQE